MNYEKRHFQCEIIDDMWYAVLTFKDANFR